MSKLNVDYILALKKDDKGLLYTEKVEITHPKDVLKKLDEFREGDYDIFDVIRYVDGLNYNKNKMFSYCWPHEYYESYIRYANILPYFLHIFTNAFSKTDYDDSDIIKWEKDYFKEMEYIRECIEIEYKEKKEHPTERMDRPKYLEYIAKLDYEMQKAIKERQLERKKLIKNNYIDEIRRYVYGMCYEQTLSSAKPTSLMYSNENIGWYRPEYPIADNVLISVRTNFCYGQSAYFHVNLNYKGINILPYTNIINYYWSNMMDNVRYTMDYVPARSNWENALSFVEGVSNLITTDSEKFEKEWIIEKIEKMMDGFKSINDNIAKYYEEQREAKEKAEEEEKKAQKEHREIPKIIKYRFVDDLTIKRHKMYEHETLLTIQVDKLTAALALLEDLTAIQNIYSPILNHIETIVQYNKELLPAITLCRNNLHERLKVLNDKLDNFHSLSGNARNEMQAVKVEINQRLEETYEHYQQLSTQDIAKQTMLKKECEKDKRYIKLQNTLSELCVKINETLNEIKDIESFDKHLSERKEYIENKLKERAVK